MREYVLGVLFVSLILTGCAEENATPPTSIQSTAPSLSIISASWSTADKLLSVTGLYDRGNQSSNNTAVNVVISDTKGTVLGRSYLDQKLIEWAFILNNPTNIPCSITAAVADNLVLRVVDNARPDCQNGANQTPVAIILPTEDLNIFVGDSVVFIGDKSFDPDGDISLSYAWIFAGGSPQNSTTANPGAVTFASEGIYQVSLAVTDSLELTSTRATINVNVTAVNVNPPPVDPPPVDPPPVDPSPINLPPDGSISSIPTADPLSVIRISAGNTISFTATATDPENDSVSFEWTFEGGVASTNTGAGPISVSYPTASQNSVPFVVSLTAVDNKGNRDPTAATISVLVSPAIAVTSQTISFIEINDMHAHLTLHADLKRISTGPAVGTAIPVMRGGLARIATKIKQIRLENPNSLVLTVGDTFYGGVEAFYSVGNDIVDVMNAIDTTQGLGIDVGVPGNWDFAYGPNVTRARFTNDFAPVPRFVIKKPTYPNLAANVITTNQRAGETLLPATWSTNLNGINIGVIGIASDIVPFMHPNLAMNMIFLQGELEYKNLINTLAASLRVGNGITPAADIVVVLSELGIHKDKRLADIIDPNSVDVFFSAHTQELTETAISSLSGALVVESGNDTTIGRMDIVIDSNKKILSRNWQIIPIENTIVEDPAIANFITSVRVKYLDSNVDITYPLITSTQRLQQPIDTVLAVSDGLIARDRSLENSFNKLFTDLLLQSFSGDGAQLAITPGFRFSTVVPALDALYADNTVATGEITIEDVYRFLPVPYTLSIGDITGKNLKFIIDKSLRNVYSTDVFKQQRGWFDGYAGLLMGLNLTQPLQPVENPDGTVGVGTRITSLMLEVDMTAILDTDSLSVVGCTKPFDSNVSTTICSYNDFTGVILLDPNGNGDITAIDFLIDALANSGDNLVVPPSRITDSSNTPFWPAVEYFQPLSGISSPIIILK